MDLDQFHFVLDGASARGYALNDNQRTAVNFAGGPLWLIAGPGSGKTEVLVTRTLRLLCVDPRSDPRSVLITTFTRKAARNLEDRLATYLNVLQAADPSLRDVDLADLRVGTIHSLCNDILLEYRDPAYQNVRLLDDVDQHLFVYRYADIVGSQDIGFWRFFSYVVPRWGPNAINPPNRWQKAKAAVTLFNHIAEDLIEPDRLAAQEGYWATLADYYRQYSAALTQRYRCDFAHLEAAFLDFLNRPAGRRFLDGEGATRLPLRHVLVDEYQDTNPIQERIYLALANRPPHSLTVVGDDDQALYRFRGGTVACMVNFDRACQTAFDEDPQQVPLNENYRSHERIVGFCNRYIASFPDMNAEGVRAPNKSGILPASSIVGNYPAVAWISGRSAADLPRAMADLVVNHLVADGILTDLSQCAVLFRSTRDSVQNAGPYLAEFRRRNIPVYNPRAKSFLDSVEVQCLLAALIDVVDVNGMWNSNLLRDFRPRVQGWIDTLRRVRDDPRYNTVPLREYILSSNRSLRDLCRANAGAFINLSLLEIIYRVISLEPFRTWRQDPEANQRLSKVTRLLESYHSMNLDILRAAAIGDEPDLGFLQRFYYMFIGYLIDTGIDDDEDEDVVVPRGFLPFMTIHQAKGLEFPFVLACQLGHDPSPGSAQILEQEFAPFREDLYQRSLRGPGLLALEDDIRLLYVAYSRAQYALVLVGTPEQIRNGVAAPGRDYTSFRRNVPVI